MRHGAPTLEQLATKAGFSQRSLAEATGLDYGTVSRHWDEPDGLFNFDARSRELLEAYVPGVADALQEHPLQDKERRLLAQLRTYGVTYLEPPLSRSNKTDLPAQFLLCSLEAAVALFEEDYGRTTQLLRPLWGRSQSVALDIIFGTDMDYGLAVGTNTLISQATNAVEKFLAEQPTWPKSISIAHLSHIVAKSGAETPLVELEQGDRAKARGRNLAFARRGSMMGQLRGSSADIDLADVYQNLIQTDKRMRQIECWAFPAWTGDSAPSERFELRRVQLRRTAIEIIREVEHYNEPYVYYLVNTYIPLALEETDETFGGKAEDLSRALLQRLDTVQEKGLRKKVEDLARELG